MKLYEVRQLISAQPGCVAVYAERGKPGELFRQPIFAFAGIQWAEKFTPAMQHWNHKAGEFEIVPVFRDHFGGCGLDIEFNPSDQIIGFELPGENLLEIEPEAKERAERLWKE